jgi:tRNA pseudouridine13 synthase
MLRATDQLAYLTADTPGTGGVIQVRPEDFLVEEQALYEPCGEGEHLYIYIEKREQTTSDVMRRLAKMFGVRRGDIGYAGLKDKQAITRQHFSIYKPDPHDDQKLLERIGYTRFKLLWAARHTNKLRRGHLRGNRFVIYIRQVNATDVIRAKPVFDLLVRSGAPNYIGDQRFGYRQNNHVLGRLYMLGRWKELLDEISRPSGARRAAPEENAAAGGDEHRPGAARVHDFELAKRGVQPVARPSHPRGAFRPSRAGRHGVEARQPGRVRGG